MPNILREFKHDLVDFFLVLQVSSASYAVADGLNRGNKIFLHDAGLVCSIGIFGDSALRERRTRCSVQSGIQLTLSVGCLLTVAFKNIGSPVGSPERAGLNGRIT